MIKCQWESGQEVYLRHVTVDAVIISDGKILLIKRSHDASVEAGKYAMPGGFMDRDESAKEAIIREVYEETGHETIKTEFIHLIDEPRQKGDDW